MPTDMTKYSLTDIEKAVGKYELMPTFSCCRYKDNL